MHVQVDCVIPWIDKIIPIYLIRIACEIVESFDNCNFLTIYLRYDFTYLEDNLDISHISESVLACGQPWNRHSMKVQIYCANTFIPK